MRIADRWSRALGAALLGMAGCSGTAAEVARAPDPPSPAPAATPVSNEARAPSAGRAPGPLSEEALEAHVRALTTERMAGRRAGSAGERAAARYVLEQLRGWDLEAEIRPFSLEDGGESRNVVATIPGARSGTIVVGAHIDHLGVRDGRTYPGAEDNASGVAVLLEIGRRFAGEREGRSVVLGFFGGEEVGLQGSAHFVKKGEPPPSAIDAMVNIDMIGRPLIDHAGLSWPKRMVGLDDMESVGVVGTRDRPWLRRIVIDAFEGKGLEVWAAEDLPPGLSEWVERQGRTRADNASFQRVGIPSVFFSAGESDAYHRPGDTIEGLVWPLMAARGRAIFEVVRALRESTEIPPRTGAPHRGGAAAE